MWRVLLCAAALLAGSQAAAQPVRIVLAGDSTVHDRSGWGAGFRAAFDERVEVVNTALGGRSSKSFRDEGAWAKALAHQPHYLVIQFGHNDCPGKGPARETDPATTYRENMIRYVEEARAAGAVAVLATSIVRRNFEPDGKIVRDCLVPFVEQTRRIAGERNVALLDLYALTLAQAEALGPGGADDLGVKAPLPGGRPDRTHLGPKGSEIIGAMVARELARARPELTPYLR